VVLYNDKNALNRQEDNGFTIVELLVVIVVIGILAAITLVSYTGITARANSSGAQSAANQLVMKVNAYVVEPTPTNYPITFGALTADATKSYYVSGVTNLSGASEMSAQPASPSTIQFLVCGVGTSGAATSYANLILGTSTVTGIKIDYWKYDGTPAVQNYTVGTVYSSGSTFATLNGYTISCWPSNS
jgi:prepilin-type N-terminal cleavage/methylation domain-containing protein